MTWKLASFVNIFFKEDAGSESIAGINIEVPHNANSEADVQRGQSAILLTTKFVMLIKIVKTKGALWNTHKNLF